MASCAKMDEEEEISVKLLNVSNKNELGMKSVSFQWTFSKGITNAMRMNYCNKEHLRFETLKRISVHDTIEYECELESAKEKLGNAKVNQTKIFLVIEQGIGKDEDDVSVVIHRGMRLHGK